MSLASLAIRLATIRALKGRTFAENRVYDSKIATIEALSAEAAPVIIVTTDDDINTVTGKDITGGNHKLELVIEIVVASRLTITTGDDCEEVLNIPATDAGLEATINLIGWQVSKALAADGGAWGDLWRKIVFNVETVYSKRGADDTNGVRYAARQYIFQIDHIAEPEAGHDMSSDSLWSDIVNMLKADNDFSAIGKVIEAEITAGDYLPWEKARAALGVANDVAEIIGSKPIKIETVVPLAAIETTDGFTLDQETADIADGTT